MSTNPIPYDIAFTLLVVLVALLSGPKLARASRILIVLYAPFALALSVYYLAFKRDTWSARPNDVTLPDDTHYSRAARRSSAIYIIMNFILLVGAKILGVSYSSVGYNYLSLFVTMMIAYVYDRCISTDDGLAHLQRSAGTTILDAYLSFCSPSFMRYVMVIACEIALTILISYFIGALIPAHCWVAGTLFRKSIVPVVVFAVVTGPLRFAWAYPTVSAESHIPYLLAYTIIFTLLAVITYASGSVKVDATAGVLILMALVAVILQTGGLSNAPDQPDLFTEVSVMPLWLMAILSTIIVLCTLVIAYRIFVDYLHPFILNTSDKKTISREVKASAVARRQNESLRR